jgi:hypothetical protein
MISADWFYGVVENVDDEMKLGRVQVRVYGVHDSRKEILDTKFLPWAHVMVPATSSSTAGIGRSPTGLQVGSEVFGISLDKTYNELRVLFSWSAQQGDVSDVSLLATGGDDPLAKAIKDALLKDVLLSSSNKISEPETERAVKYPLNDVYTTRAGFKRESDSSDGKSRETELHPSGMYDEWRTDGSKQQKIKSWFRIVTNRAVDIILGSKWLKVAGNFVTRVETNLYQWVNNQTTISTDKYLLRSMSGVEISTPEVRISQDMRVGKAIYVPEIYVGSLKANSISCSGSISGVCTGAEQAGIAGGLSSVTLSPGEGAGDVTTKLEYKDNGGDYPL